MSLLKKLWKIKINSNQDIKPNLLIQILSSKLKDIQFQQVQNNSDIVFQFNNQKNQCLCKIESYSQIKTISLNYQTMKLLGISNLIKQLKNLAKKKLTSEWGKSILISAVQNVIKIKLPPQQTYPEKNYKQIKMLHIYLYKNNTVGQSQPISHIQSNQQNQGQIQFRPGAGLSKQQYKYKFGIEIFSNQIIIAKQGTIVVFGQLRHEDDIIFPNNSTNYLKKLKQKLDQLKKLRTQKNILYIGTTGTGKSLYIKYFMKMLRQRYQFSYIKEPIFNGYEKYCTKKFTRYKLKLKQNFKLVLIDSPGFGGKIPTLSTKQFNNLYFNALTYLLTGSLNQDQFQIPLKLDVEGAKIKPIKQKRIDYCLIFIHPHQITQVKELINLITLELNKNNIPYGFILNHADQYLVDYLPSSQRINDLKKIISSEYSQIQENQIFVQSLNQVYFPQNELFYHEFNRCNYFSLASTMK